MKFAHKLLALQADCPAEFSGRFINYKQLKKIIKQIRDVEAAGGPDSPAEAQFLHLLNVEVAAVNRTFETYAQDLVHAAALKRRRRKSCCLPRLRKQNLKEDELAEHAQWCRRFASVNATGLRKIAKKHDKYAQNDAGKQFVQACWDCRNKELGAFLHSPLIDELRALERLSNAHHNSRAALERVTPAQTSGLAGSERLPWVSEHGDGVDPATGRAALPPLPLGSMSARQHSTLAARTTAASEGDAAQMDAAPPDMPGICAAAAFSEDTTPGDSPRSGDSAESTSFRCAICLAPMWMPVGLSCGHIFCAECVFQAVGVRAWTRPLDQVLADVPPTAKCPKCRQRYVFREVLELHEFGAVIRFKYPEAVSHRAAAAAAAFCHLQEELRAAHHSKEGPAPAACEEDCSVTACLAPTTGSPTRWGSGRRRRPLHWSSSALSRSAKMRSAAAAAYLSSWSLSRADSDWWDVDRAIQWGMC